MNMFASSMKDRQYKLYRKTLDYLNNTYPLKFWSAERLIRFTKVEHSKIFLYQDVESLIVQRIHKLIGQE